MRLLQPGGWLAPVAIHMPGVPDAGIAYLQKPITPDALLRKVRQVLHGPGE